MISLMLGLWKTLGVCNHCEISWSLVIAEIVAWLFTFTPVVIIFGIRSSRGTSPCSVAGKDEVRKTDEVGAATLVLF